MECSTKEIPNSMNAHFKSRGKPRIHSQPLPVLAGFTLIELLVVIPSSHSCCDAVARARRLIEGAGHRLLSNTPDHARGQALHGRQQRQHVVTYIFRPIRKG